ncbi:MAG: XTP/dITP diphosphatase [Maioricimonas sp. JB045]
MSTPESTTIVIASRNAKKLGELRELLAPGGLDVVSVGDFPDVPEVVEDGTTFAENAAKKATQTARYLQQWALGEDSGLMVDALDGAPGIYSARYSGPDATDERNNQKLIEALSGVPPHKRGAGYVCSIAVADPQGEVQLTVEQRCRGRISEEPRGTNGFGYDPYFLIPEYHRTFGELSPVVKRQLSHRGRALRQLVPALTKLFS